MEAPYRGHHRPLPASLGAGILGDPVADLELCRHQQNW